MNLEAINESWAEDCILLDDVYEQAKRIPRLHQKYYHLYIKDVLRLKALKSQLVELKVSKTEWMNGTMDPSEMRQRGWLAFNKRILKVDISNYLEADPDVINLNTSIALADARVKYLEDILKQVHGMGYLIKSMTDWEKFKSGS